MKTIGALLDGKKTLIGVLILVTVGLLAALGILDQHTAVVLTTIGAGFFGTGVSHKADKILAALLAGIVVAKNLAEKGEEVVGVLKDAATNAEPAELPNEVTR